MYRSPNSSVNNDSALFELLKQVSNRNTVIMGDFNYLGPKAEVEGMGPNSSI